MLSVVGTSLDTKIEIGRNYTCRIKKKVKKGFLNWFQRKKGSINLSWNFLNTAVHKYKYFNQPVYKTKIVIRNCSRNEVLPLENNLFICNEIRFKIWQQNVNFIFFLILSKVIHVFCHLSRRSVFESVSVWVYLCMCLIELSVSMTEWNVKRTNLRSSSLE